MNIILEEVEELEEEEVLIKKPRGENLQLEEEEEVQEEKVIEVEVEENKNI